MTDKKVNRFEQLANMNFNEYIEKKNGLSYLSWSIAWQEFCKVYPDATYTIKKDEQMNCAFGNEKIGYMVFTTVTVEGLTHEMWLPVMDFKNKSLLNPTTFDINKALMRCMVKNLAMFGLGLYIYSGSDLPTEPEIGNPKDTPEEKAEVAKIWHQKISEIKVNMILEKARIAKVPLKQILDFCKVNTVEEINESQFAPVMAQLQITLDSVEKKNQTTNEII